jgi:hypothetical protein
MAELAQETPVAGAEIEASGLDVGGAAPAWEGAAAGGSGLLIERLLREPESLWRQVAPERELGRLNRQLVVASWVPLSVHGAVLGASNGVLQALASAVKLPLLFLLTLVICLPALYLFNLVFGSRLRASQTLAVVLAAIATTGVRRRTPRALLRGYPPGEFPHQGRLSGPLAELCASQASLLALYASLPSSHPARPGLLVFLEELRGLMDGAYELAALAGAPTARARLERLVHDARGAIREMSETTEHHLADAAAPRLDGELELRIDVMRALARDVD